MSNYDDEPTIELEKTELRVQDGELQRLNSQGGYMMRLRLGEIEQIETGRRFEFIFSSLFIAAGVGIGAIGWYFSEYNVLNVVLYVLMVLFVGFGILGGIQVQIFIRTRDGWTTIYCNDNLDEAECFVTSVRQLLRGLGPPAPPAPNESSDDTFRA